MKNQSKDEEAQDLLFLKNSSNDLSFLDIEQNQYDDSVDELTKISCIVNPCKKRETTK